MWIVYYKDGFTICKNMGFRFIGIFSGHLTKPCCAKTHSSSLMFLKKKDTFILPMADNWCNLWMPEFKCTYLKYPAQLQFLMSNLLQS